MELEIDCSTTFEDNGESYVNDEKMTFKANADGKYQLIETEWSDSEGNLETYTFENGELTSCTVDDCSCSVCDDKKTVSYTCDDDEKTCNSMNPYYGTFANTFDFEDSASSKIKMTSLIVSGLLGAILLLPWDDVGSSLLCPSYMIDADELSIWIRHRLIYVISEIPGKQLSNKNEFRYIFSDITFLAYTEACFSFLICILKTTNTNNALKNICDIFLWKIPNRVFLYFILSFVYLVKTII